MEFNIYCGQGKYKMKQLVMNWIHWMKNWIYWMMNWIHWMKNWTADWTISHTFTVQFGKNHNAINMRQRTLIYPPQTVSLRDVTGNQKLLSEVKIKNAWKMLMERLLYVENAWDKNAVCENVEEPSCEITKAEKAVEKTKQKTMDQRPAMESVRRCFVI